MRTKSNTLVEDDEVVMKALVVYPPLLNDYPDRQRKRNFPRWVDAHPRLQQEALEQFYQHALFLITRLDEPSVDEPFTPLRWCQSIKPMIHRTHAKASDPQPRTAPAF